MYIYIYYTHTHTPIFLGAAPIIVDVTQVRQTSQWRRRSWLKRHCGCSSSGNRSESRCGELGGTPEMMVYKGRSYSNG